MKKQTPCGILNINKPAGLTSRQVVNKIQRLAKPAKVGHAGTLDPLATGVLAVCVGQATRLVPYIQQYHKQYVAQFLLGKRSDTDDNTGEVVDVPFIKKIERSDIEQLLPQFRGKIEQVPPQFSAIHINGKRAYELARQGNEVNIPAREVEIYELELTEFDFPKMTLEMKCGSGTYVRSVGRDLGNLLNCGAVMTDLVRTEIGSYHISSSVTLEEIEAGEWQDFLQPPESAVAALPSYHLSDEDCKNVVHGKRITPVGGDAFEPQATIALFTQQGQLAGLAEYKSTENQLAPRIVFLR